MSGRRVEDLEQEFFEEGPLNVSADLAGQLEILGRAREVVGVNIITLNGRTVHLDDLSTGGFCAAKDFRRIINMRRWPDTLPQRNGFTVPQRNEGLVRARYADDLLRPLPQNRDGDVYMGTELAEAVKQINHPAILQIILEIQKNAYALLDARSGISPKGIIVPEGDIGRHSVLLTADDFRRRSTDMKRLRWQQILKDKVPPLELPTCEFYVEGDELEAAWNFQMEENGGFELPYISDVIMNGKQKHRSGMIVELAKQMFQIKVGEANAERFFKQLTLAALNTGRTGKFAKYSPIKGLFFRRLEGNDWQAYVKIKLIDPTTPGGPKERIKISGEEGHRFAA